VGCLEGALWACWCWWGAVAGVGNGVGEGMGWRVVEGDVGGGDGVYSFWAVCGCWFDIVLAKICTVLKSIWWVVSRLLLLSQPQWSIYVEHAELTMSTELSYHVRIAGSSSQDRHFWHVKVDLHLMQGRPLLLPQCAHNLPKFNIHPMTDPKPRQKTAIVIGNPLHPSHLPTTSPPPPANSHRVNQAQA